MYISVRRRYYVGMKPYLNHNGVGVSEQQDYDLIGYREFLNYGMIAARVN